MSADSNILWRCRRGIREMDLLLQRFVSRHYKDLTDEQKQSFSSLLDEADLDIMDWIMGRKPAPTKEYRSLINLICDINNPNYR
jgi:antitoxin CptB